MDYKKIIITTFLIVIPLILLILCYRNYVFKYCNNDMKCLKEKLIFNLNNINDNLKKESFELSHKKNNITKISEMMEEEEGNNGMDENLSSDDGDDNQFDDGSDND